MEDSKKLQNVYHFVRSPFKFLGSILGSFSLEALVSATSWCTTGVMIPLVVTVVAPLTAGGW